MRLISQSTATPVHGVIEDAGLSAADFYGRLLGIADQVSELLLGFYHGPEAVKASKKADQSPITAADHAAHTLLLDELVALTPQVPVLSEESDSADIAERHRWPITWMVDPLDGTREFLDRTDQFTTNIALIIAGRPALGLISVPVSGVHYLGVPGAGAWRFGLGAGLSGEACSTRAMASERPLVLLASARHRTERVEAMMAALQDLAPVIERRNAGSAVKFCELLEDSADVYPRSSPCYEWDVAAGDALVTAAGGQVADYAGEPLQYNARDTLLAERFFAAGDPEVDYLARLSRVVGLSPSQPRS